MANVKDLGKAMKAALDETGDIIKLRTRLEEDVLEALTHVQSQSQHKGTTSHTFMTKRCKPAMPPEIILANNLIHQYLDHVGLQNTSEVLCAESGMPEKTSSPSVQGSHKRPHICSMVEKVINRDTQIP